MHQAKYIMPFFFCNSPLLNSVDLRTKALLKIKYFLSKSKLEI